jgi:hypothetical protein
MLASLGSSDFRLVDWGELTKTNLSIDDEEVQILVFELSLWGEQNNLTIRCGSHLFGRNCNLSRIGPTLVRKRLLHLLISCRDNLVQREFQLTNEVMSRKILGLIIVAVINFHLILVVLLEMEVSLDLLDPLWV